MARRRPGLSLRRQARRAYERAVRTSRPGGGARFRALVRVARLGGATNPEAVASAIGRRKYGKKRFQEMAVAGRRRARRSRGATRRRKR